jgi:5'-3' exonuclease
MRHTLLAVDGNSLVHRSFHALVDSNLRTADGRPTWAVKGFCAQMLTALERTGADALVVGFDDSSTSFRKLRWPHYKATRKPKPPELGQQIALTIDLLRAAGVQVVVPTGLEADDVLASAARTAAAAGWNAVLVTSDCDSFALVDEATSVLRIINGGVDMSPLLNRERLRTLVRVHAHQYAEYAAMRGDTSDNLVGIHGVGAKTAVKLLAEFGTVGAAFADADAGGDRVAAALGKAAVGMLLKPENRAAFHRNVEIMTMHADVELGLELATGGVGCLPCQPDRVVAALDSFELRSVRDLALRALTYMAVQSAPSNVPATQPWPNEPPPAELDRELQPAGAAAGSPSAQPDTWQDTLF